MTPARADKKPAVATDRAATSLDAALQRLVDAAAARVLAAVPGTDRSTSMNNVITDRVSGLAGKAKEKAVEVKDRAVGVTGSVRHPGGDSGGITVIEHIDAGVPVEVAYEEWTKFSEFAEFMDPAQAKVLEEVPKERIVWRSSSGKGHIDGAVTFHQLAPQLSRVVVVLECHPRGIVERAGSVLRPAGRRLRGELGNFQRQVMAERVLHSAAARKAVKKRRKTAGKSIRSKTAKAKGAKG